ncbi:MAG: ABC transporter permease, partial [Proteobacteria bacterium]|nr:ABC transporter permease [Pseudomonadota bacterium]
MIARIAFRNIFRQKRRSILTALMIAGGFALSSVSLGISEGSYDRIIDMFTRDHTGHVQVHRSGYLDRPSIYKTITDPQALGAALAEYPGVAAWAPRLYSPALAFRGKKTTGAQLVGVDPEREGITTRLPAKISQGRFLTREPEYGVLLASGLARILQAEIGDEIVLIAQGADGSIANDLFRVVGILGASGQVRQGMRCYLHIEAAREFLVLPDRAHEVALLLDEPRDSRTIAADLTTALGRPDLDIDPWEVVEHQFYQAMRADVQGMWITLVIVMIIVAVGILNTVLMTILERTREFGVLRALGTRPRDVFALVVLETSFLALLSLVPGVLLGAGCNHLLAVYGIQLPSPVEYGGVVI